MNTIYNLIPIILSKAEPIEDYHCLKTKLKEDEIWFVWSNKCYWIKENQIVVDSFWRPNIWDTSFYLILKESSKFKKWAFSSDDIMIKDSINPNVILEKYNGTTYNLWNLCYQNYKPSIFDYSIYITECNTLSKLYWERWDFNWYMKLSENLCLPVFEKKKFQIPKLKRCEKDQKPGLYYENCCSEQEYDLLMLIRSKIKSKEIKTKDDMIKFVRTENQRYEQSQKEIPKKIQDFEGISFVSIIFLFLIIFIKLFKSKKAS